MNGLADSIPPAEAIAAEYGFGRVAVGEWIGSQPGRTARIRADGREYVARLYGPDEAEARVPFLAELRDRLRACGLRVERTLRTAAGDAFSRLPSGGAMVLSVRHRGASMRVPFSQRDARRWGRFVARWRVACEGWDSAQRVPAGAVQTAPVALFQEAQSLAKDCDRARGILARWRDSIVVTCESAASDRALEPVHGDLWPGNLLAEARGLRAIDFRASGYAPGAFDVATAFRWMPWRKDTVQAGWRWRAWLSGYRSVRGATLPDLSGVPALACLQHLHFLTEEASAAQRGEPGYGDASWYVEDHCDAIDTLLSSR
jgi:Ser/Thr protein kinase RdoA (MazF antagonist)